MAQNIPFRNNGIQHTYVPQNNGLGTKQWFEIKRALKKVFLISPKSQFLLNNILLQMNHLLN